ncbi:hypothetical protein EYZ11_011084 [Aspergillus tanneri]|uniref:Uncharacterized protein n=1 Tax=Aspergillus tanneri TaxID=1220188 RepID=A0A4S3J4A8_9EURO|nr:hypothetical protein EYZ11_011084 [Aspergillus tanneri]
MKDSARPHTFLNVFIKVRRDFIENPAPASVFYYGLFYLQTPLRLLKITNAKEKQQNFAKFTFATHGTEFSEGLSVKY